MTKHINTRSVYDEAGCVDKCFGRMFIVIGLPAYETLSRQ